MRGLTFLENDRDFSLIEKRKRTAQVLLPGDWTQVIREANLKKPFIPTEVKKCDMKYWKGHLTKTYKMGEKYQDGSQVRIREMQWMNFWWGEEEDEEGTSRLEHHPNEIWIRTGFSSSEPWKKLKVKEIQTTTDQPEHLYHSKLSLNPAKVKDLKAMASKYMPEHQRALFTNGRR